MHGRLDLPWATETFAVPTPGLVAISANQASSHPAFDWAGVVHNGLTLDGSPFERRRGDALCFVGRVAPEKGIVEAIEIAQLSDRPLKIAAKVHPTGPERAYYDAVFLPALEAAGSSVEFLGELDQADRDQLFAESYASLMPGSWPEPFGLVAIEALACGTPVIARRVGGLPEIIRDGVDGFFGDDATQLAFQVPRVEELDRQAIRDSVLDRFSAGRMTDGYEAIYRAALAGGGASTDAERRRRQAVSSRRCPRWGTAPAADARGFSQGPCKAPVVPAEVPLSRPCPYGGPEHRIPEDAPLRSLLALLILASALAVGACNSSSSSSSPNAAPSDAPVTSPELEPRDEPGGQPVLT